jgi:hypothetical protein
MTKEFLPGYTGGVHPARNRKPDGAREGTLRFQNNQPIPT